MKTETIQTFKASTQELDKVIDQMFGSCYLAVGESDVFILGGYGVDHPEEWAQIVESLPCLVEANPDLTLNIHR